MLHGALNREQPSWPHRHVCLLQTCGPHDCATKQAYIRTCSRCRPSGHMQTACWQNCKRVQALCQQRSTCCCLPCRMLVWKHVSIDAQRKPSHTTTDAAAPALAAGCNSWLQLAQIWIWQQGTKPRQILRGTMFLAGQLDPTRKARRDLCCVCALRGPPLNVRLAMCVLRPRCNQAIQSCSSGLS